MSWPLFTNINRSPHRPGNRIPPRPRTTRHSPTPSPRPAAPLHHATDPAERESWRAELDDKEAQLARLDARLKDLLLPRDPNEGRNVILQIQGTEGGEEANLWAGDLYRTYQHIAERPGLQIETMSRPPSVHGG